MRLKKHFDFYTDLYPNILQTTLASRSSKESAQTVPVKLPRVTSILPLCRTPRPRSRIDTLASVLPTFERTRQIIRCRVTATLRRPQTKQDTASNKGWGVQTKKKM